MPSTMSASSTMPAPSTGSVPDRGPNLMALLWVTTSLSLGVVMLRLASRARRGRLGWDDCFMLLAMACFIGWSVSLTLLCLKGGERHIQDVAALGVDVISQVQLLNWTAQVFGILGVCAGKVSVSALLLAIMGRSHRRWQIYYLWTFCIVIAVCAAVACSILTFAQCRPAAALWDPRVHGECLNPVVMADYGTFMGAYNTFVDASLALVPSTIFWSLQMGKEDKLKLSLVFALNILTSICSGIKTSYLSQLANRTDFTWATYDIFAWVTAEFFLVIVCGTVPTLRAIFEFVAQRWSQFTPKHYGSSNHRGFSAVHDPTPTSEEELAAVPQAALPKSAVSVQHHLEPASDLREEDQIRVRTVMNVEYNSTTDRMEGY